MLNHRADGEIPRSPVVGSSIAKRELPTGAPSPPHPVLSFGGRVVPSGLATECFGAGRECEERRA